MTTPRDDTTTTYAYFCRHQIDRMRQQLEAEGKMTMTPAENCSSCAMDENAPFYRRRIWGSTQ